MERWERELKIAQLQKSLSVESNFDKPIEDIAKSRSGVYANNTENRKQGRAGERYGAAVHGGQTQQLEGEEVSSESKENIQNVIKKISGGIETFKKQLTISGLGTYDRNRVKEEIKFWEQKLDYWKKQLVIKEIANSPSKDGDKKDIESFLSIIRLLDNKIKIEDIEVEATPKGNWAVYVKGKEMTTVKGSLLSEQLIEKYSLRKSTESTIYKAFEDGLLSKDVFEKAGKVAQIGEVRTWHGVQMRKVSATGNSKMDWQPVESAGKGKKSEGDKKPDSEKEKPGEGKVSDQDLKEHAKQSSEAALQAAIKNSDDPAVREVAHQELARRKQEEAPQEKKDEFPSKEMKGKQTEGSKSKDEGSKEKTKEQLRENLDKMSSESLQTLADIMSTSEGKKKIQNLLKEKMGSSKEKESATEKKSKGDESEIRMKDVKDLSSEVSDLIKTSKEKGDSSGLEILLKKVSEMRKKASTYEKSEEGVKKYSNTVGRGLPSEVLFDMEFRVESAIRRIKKESSSNYVQAPGRGGMRKSIQGIRYF